MARQPLTPAQIKARTAKAKATREAKKKAALEALGLDTPKTSKPKKMRKTRKMTPEQKKAAADRLRKARENKEPSQNKMVDESVRNLPDDYPFSLKNVREWIKENKQMLTSIRSFKDSKDASERAKYQSVETYVANLEAYLRSGVYLDNRWGAQAQNKINYRVTVMAYYNDGTPKRSVGWLYPDIGVYTQEMADEDRARRQTVSNKGKVRKAS